MIRRTGTNKSIELNVVGSSVYGRYPKISIEKTVNMFESDGFMVPYAGYSIAILADKLGNSSEGRGIYTSTKLGCMIAVLGRNVYRIVIFFDQEDRKAIDAEITPLGTLNTSSGPVYITENNKPQIAISDGGNIYIYDPAATPSFFEAATPDFTPGYISFHDTYFLAAAKDNAQYTPSATNTWILSGQNDGTVWTQNAATVGLIQTKPDKIKAAVRFPSKGNMIWVMGETVTEAWFDVGNQKFPYQRVNQYNIDYGCISEATIASMDEIVVWLAQNEKSGPVIMYSSGGMPQKISTDGIDYLFSQLTAPEDSQAFLYRQDGHLFYHINFYTDNLSIYYDFNTQKIYNACDQDLNYFIASQVCFFNNQYYFISRNTGNIYAFDTIYTTFQDTDTNGNIVEHEVPRFRTCRNIRLPTQEYFVANDIGFTIESGYTNYQKQFVSNFYLITQDGKFIITQGNSVFFITQDGNNVIAQNGNNLIFQQTDNSSYFNLIAQDNYYLQATPRVDLSVSFDGGASFSSDMPYNLPAIGHYKNRLMWWQGGISNDYVCQFKFWSLGRFVVTDGIVNIRQ